MQIARFTQWVVAKENPSSSAQAVRTAVAAIVAYLVARLFRLPEAYWAPISTLIVMQSTFSGSLPVSAQRLVGTALGAVVGVAADAFFRGSIWAFGLAVLLTGMVCAVLRLERSAYRYASVTVTIVMLVPRSSSGWLIAVHRFFEVSVGIAVGLLLSALWPEGQPGRGQKAKH